MIAPLDRNAIMQCSFYQFSVKHEYLWPKTDISHLIGVFFVSYNIKFSSI